MLRRLAALLSLTLFGCDVSFLGQSCSDVGCGYGLTIDVKTRSMQPWPRGAYVVVIRADGATIEGRCTLARGSSFCSSDVGVIDVEGTLRTSLRGTPKHVELTVSYEGTTVATGSWDPVYAEGHPNGPSCEPTCHGALVDVTIDAPPMTVPPDAGAD